MIGAKADALGWAVDRGEGRFIPGVQLHDRRIQPRESRLHVRADAGHGHLERCLLQPGRVTTSASGRRRETQKVALSTWMPAPHDSERHGEAPDAVGPEACGRPSSPLDIRHSRFSRITVRS